MCAIAHCCVAIAGGGTRGGNCRHRQAQATLAGHRTHVALKLLPVRLHAQQRGEHKVVLSLQRRAAVHRAGSPQLLLSKRCDKRPVLVRKHERVRLPGPHPTARSRDNANAWYVSCVRRHAAASPLTFEYDSLESPTGALSARISIIGRLDSGSLCVPSSASIRFLREVKSCADRQPQTHAAASKPDIRSTNWRSRRTMVPKFRPLQTLPFSHCSLKFARVRVCSWCSASAHCTGIRLLCQSKVLCAELMQLGGAEDFGVVPSSLQWFSPPVGKCEARRC